MYLTQDEKDTICNAIELMRKILNNSQDDLKNNICIRCQGWDIKELNNRFVCQCCNYSWKK